MIADQGVKMPLIIGGRYGLSSKDTSPAQILSVFDNLKLKEPKNGFTIGIVDDISFKSLPVKEEISLAKSGVKECKFYGLGSDGTVGANKNTIKIIGETIQSMFRRILTMTQKNRRVYLFSLKIWRFSDSIALSCFNS